MTITRSYTAETVDERTIAEVDHSLLKPELTIDEVVAGCDAATYDVASVCARPLDVVRCVKALAGSNVLVGTVIGFPHGSSTTTAKVAEAGEPSTTAPWSSTWCWRSACVPGEDAYVQDDIAAVVDAAVAARDAIVKVILENAYLDDDEDARLSPERAGRCALCQDLDRLCPLRRNHRGPRSHACHRVATSRSRPRARRTNAGRDARRAAASASIASARPPPQRSSTT